jgi:hypothetical protein
MRQMIDIYSIYITETTKLIYTEQNRRVYSIYITETIKLVLFCVYITETINFDIVLCIYITETIKLVLFCVYTEQNLCVYTVYIYTNEFIGSDVYTNTTFTGLNLAT